MINISKLYCDLASESDKLRYVEHKLAGPVVVFNCTDKCNLKCRHCYSESKNTQKLKELDTNQAKKLINQIKQCHSPAILFSGGEPLARADLFDLLEYAKEIKMNTVISTNATLIDEAVASKLRRAKVRYVGVSIDGDEKFHDGFRGVKQSFNKTIEGIKHCQKAGLKVGLRFTMTSENDGFVPFIFDLARQHNIRRICFYHLIKVGRAKDECCQLSLQKTRQAIDTIIDLTQKAVQDGAIDEVLTVGNHADGPYLLTRMQQESKDAEYEKALQFLRYNGGNKVGQKISAVSFDGNVYADQFWRNYSLGNVTEKSFGKIWNNKNEPVLKMLNNKNEFADKRCKKCKWFEICKGNWRFLTDSPDEKNWTNEPLCYLLDSEIYES